MWILDRNATTPTCLHIQSTWWVTYTKVISAWKFDLVSDATGAMSTKHWTGTECDTPSRAAIRTSVRARAPLLPWPRLGRGEEGEGGGLICTMGWTNAVLSFYSYYVVKTTQPHGTLSRRRWINDCVNSVWLRCTHHAHGVHPSIAKLSIQPHGDRWWKCAMSWILSGIKKPESK